MDNNPTTPVTPTDDQFDRDFNAFLGGENTNEPTPEPVQPVEPVQPQVDTTKFASKDDLYVVQRTTEISSWLADNPEFKEFGEQIKKVAVNPQTANMSIEGIVGAAVGYKNMIKLAQKTKQEVIDNNADNKPLGSTARPIEKDGSEELPDAWSLDNTQWKSVKAKMGM